MSKLRLSRHCVLEVGTAAVSSVGFSAYTAVASTYFSLDRCGYCGMIAVISCIFLRMLRVLASEIIESISFCLLTDDWRLLVVRLRALTYSDGTLKETVHWI